MSHFTVIVAGDVNLKKALAPFEEQSSNPEGSPYFKFDNKSADPQEQEDYKNKTTQIVELDGVKYSRYDDFICRFEKYVKNDNSPFGDKVLELPEGARLYEGAVSEIYPTFESYLRDYCGYGYSEEHDAYGYWSNPNAKWDWYQVGGRWTGYFKGKPGVSGEQGDPGLMTDAAEAGRYDVIRLKDIDFEGMEAEAIAKANATYDKIESILKGRQYPSWKEIREKHGADIEAARNEYHNHPVVKDFNDARFDFWGDFHEIFGNSREEYVERQRKSVITPFAFLKDGVWSEKGQMGWFGMAMDEKAQNDWNDEFYEMLRSLPEDTLLTAVDCHI